MTRYPETRYRLTQLAVVQEQALTQAQNRMNQLQAELQQARQGGPGPAGGPARPRGALRRPAAAAAARVLRRPVPAAARTSRRRAAAIRPATAIRPAAIRATRNTRNRAAGMFQRGGSGFLGSALTTAAGVAGGVVAGNALMNMFSGHHEGGFGGEGYGQGGFGQGRLRPGRASAKGASAKGGVGQGGFGQQQPGLGGDQGGDQGGAWGRRPAGRRSLRRGRCGQGRADSRPADAGRQVRRRRRLHRQFRLDRFLGRATRAAAGPILQAATRRRRLDG